MSSVIQRAVCGGDVNTASIMFSLTRASISTTYSLALWIEEGISDTSFGSKGVISFSFFFDEIDSCVSAFKLRRDVDVPMKHRIATVPDCNPPFISIWV